MSDDTSSRDRSTFGETDCELARKILKFVNEETGGAVAWFHRTENGNWDTFVQINGWAGVSLTAPTEETLAVAYWNYYFKKAIYSLAAVSGFWHRNVFSRDKFKKAAERVLRWEAWRKENIPAHQQTSAVG
ncbi:hypothetical protein KBA73_01255 [Patescibacteria group bacterium]|nr:hypothetical protein [Patescibacteria group bacterium]